MARTALPALPVLAVGTFVAYFGLMNTGPTASFSLLAIGLLLMVCGIVLGFVQYKTDAAYKASKKDAPSDEATSAN